MHKSRLGKGDDLWGDSSQERGIRTLDTLAKRTIRAMNKSHAKVETNTVKTHQNIFEFFK